MSFAKIRPRRGTATQWTTANPILAEGEIAFEVPDEGVGSGVSKIKIGDGVTAWSDLPYAIFVHDIVTNHTTNDNTKVVGAGVAYDLYNLYSNLNTTHTTDIQAIQKQLSDANTLIATKQATITGGASTIASSNLTVSRALISNSSGKVAVSAVTSTELEYLDGVTSNIQTQLNGKASSSHSHSNYVTTNTNANLKSIDLTDSKPCIDFHFNNTTTEYNVRLWNESDGWLQCTEGFQVKKRLQVDGDTIFTPSSINFVINTGTSGYSSLTARAFNQVSSKKVKENIVDMTNDEAKKLLDIDIVGFDYIEDIGGDKNQYGVIAEDVKDVLPHVVYIPDDYDETKTFEENNGVVPSVDYSKFVPHLIKMLQIQQTEIEELKKKIS